MVCTCKKPGKFLLSPKVELKIEARAWKFKFMVSSVGSALIQVELRILKYFPHI